MANYKTPLDQANAITTKRPRSSTPEQMEQIRNNAIKEFGFTNRFQDSFWMLPDGRMLSGTGGQRFGRIYDHRDINGPYIDANVDLDDEIAGNTTNMLDFMRAGNLRLVPENEGIDIASNPTPQQLNAIIDLWRRGKINNIQATNPNDDYGQQLGYLEEIAKESQIYDFIRKYYGN